MSATQRARSGVPLDVRSALPTVPGIPAWGAVAVAAGLTFVGFVFDAVSGSDLTAAFSVLYFLGCLAAVLAVRHRGLFTAVVQPPLLLFVAVPIAQQFLAGSGGTGLKDLAFNIALPLVNRFPLMLTTTIVVALVAGARVFLAQQVRAAQSRPARRTPARAARRTERPDTVDAADARPRRTATRDTHARQPSRDRTPREQIGREQIGREQIRREPSYRADPYREHPYREQPYRAEPYREPARREPPLREPALREPSYGAPIERDPIPARPVRYRDRDETPIDL